MNAENQPSNKEKLTQFDAELGDMMKGILGGIRNVGAYLASEELRDMYPDIDWSSFPSKEVIVGQAELQKQQVFDLVNQAIDNRKAYNLLTHRIDLGED